MRRLVLLGVLWLALGLWLGLGTALPAAADAFTGGGGTPLSSAPPPASGQQPKAAPTPHEASFPGTGVVNGLVQRLAHQQMLLNDRIAHQFRTVRETGSRTALLTVLALAFLYGVLHAAGPGHGKSIVAAYFVAHNARWTSGVLMGGIISLLQGVTAILIVLLLSLFLRTSQMAVENNGALVEFISYGLVVLIGLVLLYQGLTGRGHHHHHGVVAPQSDHAHHHDHHHHEHAPVAPASGAGPSFRRILTLAAGVAPCASAIIIMLFALANGALMVGVITVMSLSLGMGLTVSAIGVLSILARGLMKRFAGGETAAGERLERALSIGGSLLVVIFASSLMLGAWVRL